MQELDVLRSRRPGAPRLVTRVWPVVFAVVLGLGACGQDASNPNGPGAEAVFADAALQRAVERHLQGLRAVPANLAAIERLDASGEGIGDLGGIEALSGLRDLELADNRIVDIGPLGGLEGLVFLDLSTNRIADIAPLAGLGRLRDLRLSSNRIHDIDPLGSLGELRFVDLARNALTDVGALAGLDSLQTLSLIGNRVRELTPLLGLGQLTHLDLEDNPLDQNARDVTLAALRAKGVQVIWRRPAETGSGEGEGPSPFALSVVGRHPDGREDVYLLDLEGAEPFNLTREPARYWDLAWSADGGRLAYAASRTVDGRGNHIYVIDADGGNKTRLSDRAGLRPQTPSFSPDGRYLAYTQQQPGGGPSHVYVVDLESGVHTDLTPGAEWAVAPVWHPDGGRLAYVESINIGRADLRMVNADGTQNRALSADFGSVAAHAWDRDGRALYCAVYNGPDDPQGADLYRYGLEEGQWENLTAAEGFDVFPALGPRGERLAFVHYREGQGGLCVKELQTGADRLLVDASAFSFISEPQWSADGFSIGFSADNSGLYLVDGEGGAWRDVLRFRLRVDRLFGGPPEWAWIPRTD